jgi:hypothetical protein
MKILSLHGYLQSSRGTATQLEQRCAELEQEREILTAKVADQQKELAVLRKVLEGKDAQISQLHAEIERLSVVAPGALKWFQNLRKERKEQRQLQADIALITGSGLFDASWSLMHYPDVAEARIDPAEHYLRFGAKEGRLPGETFDTVFYLETYPDVAETGMNPLLHYLRFGLNEGRRPIDS